MSSAVKILPHYTYEDYCLWEGRWELMDGIPWALRPIPEHQRINANMAAELRKAVKQSGCVNCKVYPSIDFKITANTIVRPDVLIVCHPIEKDYLDFAPLLVIEILCVETILKDRINKFYLYEAQEIPYYLMVDVDKNEIEIYKLDESGNYVLAPYDPAQPFTFHLEDDCQPAVVLNNIWE
jgi:Uma2 family endonuclease